MIFNKKFADITFDDVQQMVDRRMPESNFLDYKQSFGDHKKLAALVSAFANSDGGFIVIGIVEKEGTNLPESLMSLTETQKDLENVFDSFCYDLITPQILGLQRVVLSDDAGNRVMVVKVPVSDLAPHAIDNNTKIYVKIGSQKRPIVNDSYVLATVPEIEKLLSRRSRHVEVRRQVLSYHRDKRPKTISGFQGGSALLGIEALPLYPLRRLVEHTEMNEYIKRCRDAHSQRFDNSGLALGEFNQFNEGINVVTELGGIGNHVSVGSHGYISIQVPIQLLAIDNDQQRRHLNLFTLASSMLETLSFVSSCYEILEFRSSVVISVELSNILDVSPKPTGVDGRSITSLVFNHGSKEDRLELTQVSDCGLPFESVIGFVRAYLSHLTFTFGIGDNNQDIADMVLKTAYNKRLNKELPDLASAIEPMQTVWK